MLDSFLKTKEELRITLEKLKAITDGNTKDRTKEILIKLDEEQFILVAVGQFKRGKTAFINALLGKELLPSAIIPLTSIITIVEYGEELKAEVYFANGKKERINPADLSQFITEKYNPKNQKNVDYVRVFYPSAYLNGIKLVDTPGIASVHEHNTKMTYDYLPEADAAIFLVSVDPPVTKAEFDFLNDIKQYVGKIFFVLNKIDTVGEKDKKESLEFTQKIIEEHINIPDIQLSPLSAKIALEAKINKNDNLLASSGMPVFEKALENFLIKEKGKILLQSVASKSLNVAEQELLIMNIRRQSLKESADSLNVKLHKFNSALSDITTEKTNSEYLLKGEVQHIIKDIIEEDINEFRQEKVKLLIDKTRKYFAGSNIKEAEELRTALNDFVSQQIQDAFNQFKDWEEKKVNDQLEKSLSQFEGRINDIIHKIMQIGAELFNLSFDALKIERGITKKSEFHFRIDDIKVGLEIITESLSLLLPNYVRRKKLLKQSEEQIIQQMDMYSGRLRYDFVRRIQKAEMNIKVRLSQEIDEIIQDISEAIRVGDTMRKKSSKELEKEESAMEDKFSQLSRIKKELMRIKNLH